MLSPAIAAMMQMTVPIAIAVVIPAMPVFPVDFNTMDASRSVAIAMPDTGLFEEPTSPTIRALTVAKKNPNKTIRHADSRVTGIDGSSQSTSMTARIPNNTHFIGSSCSVRFVPPVFP